MRRTRRELVSIAAPCALAFAAFHRDTRARSRCVRLAVVVAGVVSGLAVALPAQAYRPFDGTDAAVADPWEMEIELGPLGYLREGGARYLLAPAVVANIGVPGA